ncbi:hypothetical protein [Desulforapulum autotrophicum]|nr:hypothetical protein [Desulforapulum autotrophicum]
MIIAVVMVMILAGSGLVQAGSSKKFVPGELLIQVRVLQEGLWISFFTPMVLPQPER